MAKHDNNKDVELEEFKKKCEKTLNEGIETAKAVGQIAGERIDGYLQKAKKHLGKFSKKASEKLAEEKENVAKRKEEIHKEREEEKILKIIEDAEEMMNISQEACDRAREKYIEALEALNKKKVQENEGCCCKEEDEDSEE